MNLSLGVSIGSQSVSAPPVEAQGMQFAPSDADDMADSAGMIFTVGE